MESATLTKQTQRVRKEYEKTSKRLRKDFEKTFKANAITHAHATNTLRTSKKMSDVDDLYEGLEDYVYTSSSRLNAALEVKDENKAIALLDIGDNPCKMDDRYYNALHIAARKGCGVRLFNRILSKFKSRANAGVYWDNGCTALMFAVVNNHLDMVTALMQHPWIDLNVQNKNMETALHLAVYNNHPAIVAQLLSDIDIDTSLRDITTATPLRLAIIWKHDECARILREHGAQEGRVASDAACSTENNGKKTD